MRGCPKYKYGDVVRFKCNENEKVGIVAIVDAYGTWDDPSDASYDILIKEEKTLYKHFTESCVIEKVGEVDPNSIWE